MTGMMNKMRSSSPPSFLFLTGLILIIATATTTLPHVFGQQVYESQQNDFRIGNLPAGWVVEDISEYDLNQGETMLQNIHDFTQIAAICPEERSMPALGGRADCTSGSGTASLTNPSEILVYAFEDLRDRPEIANAIIGQNKTITPNDMIVMFINLQERIGEFVNPAGTTTEYTMGPQQTITVQVVSPAQSEGVVETTVPATYGSFSFEVEGLYTSHTSKTFILAFVDPEQNTGYVVMNPRWPVATPQPPAEVMQIIQSFQLTTAATTTATDDDDDDETADAA